MDKMKNLRKTVLSGLRVMITDHGRKRWFKIYLTILVLLFNLETITHGSRKDVDHSWFQTQQQRTMLESWKNAAQNLIDHFRAVCRGQIPLNIQWSKAEQDAAEVDDHSMEFINRLNDLTKSRGMSACCETQVRANGLCQLKIFARNRGPPAILRSYGFRLFLRLRRENRPCAVAPSRPCLMNDES